MPWLISSLTTPNKWLLVGRLADVNKIILKGAIKALEICSKIVKECVFDTTDDVIHLKNSC